MTSKKKDQPEEKNAGTKSQNPQPTKKEEKMATKLSQTVVPQKHLSAKEDKLSAKMDELSALMENIEQIRSELASNYKLTPIAKAKLRNEILVAKTEKKILKDEISKLSKELKREYRKNASAFARKSLRISARKEYYHKRHGESIRKAITNMVSALEPNNLTALKAELANLEEKDGDALIMKALLKAPRYLHTKVVTNAEARKEYLQHFRKELGVTQKRQGQN